MLQYTSQRPIHYITWFLTGLITLVCLYNIVPAGDETLVCAEERLLEIETDGDKHDLRELEWALDLPSSNNSTSQTWQYVQVFFLWQPSQFEVHKHYGRGPPRS